MNTLITVTARGALALALATTVLLTACPDEGKRPLGSSCDANELCESGLCAFGQCLDPDGDEDLDGLTNALEAALGSNPFNPDSDYDGVLDGAELATNLTLVDTDSDGLPDILESLTRDADSDCLVDQLDPDDTTQATDLTAMKPVACNLAGVCGANLAAVTVSCPNDTKVATCGYLDVPGYETTETTCDGKDNDCDGKADEGFADSNGNGIADCADDDADADGVVGASDNCPGVPNPDQGDADNDGLGDACDLPGPVALGASPESPAATTTFTLSGTAEPLVSLSFSSDNMCQTAIGSGSGDAAGRFSVAVNVPADAVTTVYLRATNRAGLSSECRPTGLALTSDLTAPGAPAATGLPAYTNLAAVLGTISGATEATTLSLYREDVGTAIPRATGCEGTPLLTAAIAADGSVPVLIALVANRQNDLRAVLTDLAGNSSACTLLASVVHDDIAPLPPSPNAATKGLFATPQGGPNEVFVGGCAESESQVGFYLDRACAGGAVTTTANLAVDDCAEGSGFGTTLAVIENGETPYWMRVTDRAGNRSECVALGTYVHDALPPKAPVVVGASALEWAEDWVDFQVEGTSEAGGQVILSSDPTCAPARATTTVGADGRWSTVVNVKPSDTTLYALARDAAGNPSGCAAVSTLFGTATVRLVGSSSGRPMVEQPVVFTDPRGDENATIYTDGNGEAKYPIFAGYAATAVTYTSGYGYYQWTSAIGLEPGQVSVLSVYDLSETVDPNPDFTVYCEVPAPPEGTVDYKILSACGRTYPSFEGTLGMYFSTWFDPDCTMEGDFSFVVEAIGKDGGRLGYVSSLHNPFPGEGAATVVFEGPWRTDYAPFEVTLDTGGAPTPFRASSELGLHGDIFEDFWDVGLTGFVTPDADGLVSLLFPKFEHSVVGWSVEVDHLGLDNQNASRSYTVRNEYAPGSATLDFARDLLPRLWSSGVVPPSGVADSVTWTSEAGLAAQTDVMATNLYVSYESSIYWTLIARPLGGGALVVPKVRSLPGADALNPFGYTQFYGVEFIDLAEVKGFGGWARWCDARPLQACLDARSDSLTRKSSVKPRSGGGR